MSDVELNTSLMFLNSQWLSISITVWSEKYKLVLSATSFPGSFPTRHRGRVGKDPGNEVVVVLSEPVKVRSLVC